MIPRIPPGPRPAASPFFTRRSTIGFAAVFSASYLLLLSLGGTAHPNSGLTGTVLALSAATSLVTLVVTWTAGLVLAWRSRSMLWVLVACLPPPLGAVPCALFAPTQPPPGAAPRPGGAPPRRGGLR
ncbi:MAG TPA: hypothetical protein VEK76_14055 [Candidatus Binatia bacterium]|nr:hypothetical protein [Candidatus Binatia bacterium]